MWNADLYDHFDRERLQPSIDLIARLRDRKLGKIIDVGCGTGMSTAAILNTWREAEIVGVDVSGEMLQKAKTAMPEILFIQRDCSKSLLDMGTFDLIFSNAFLQWLPNQEEFIQNSFQMLNTGGIFAAQIPLFEEMAANDCIVNAKHLIADKLDNIHGSNYVLYSAGTYYNMLSECTSKISMWITDYCHEMDNYDKILEFLKGAALRPYIETLGCDELKLFLDEIQINLKNTYPCQKNGKILFPFKRLFLIGEK